MPFTSIQDKPFTSIQDKPLPVNSKWKIANGNPVSCLTREAEQNSQTSDLRSQFWRRRRPGFSLIELVISMFLIVVLASIVVTAANGLNTRRRTDLSAIAGKAATKEIEHLRNLEFLSLATANNQACDSELGGQLQNCRIDRTVSNYPGITNVKQVAITLSWTYQGHSKFVTMETLIAQGGL